MIYTMIPSFQRKIWGGTKLAKLKKFESNSSLPLGETWEISTHPEGPSKTSEGISLEKIVNQLSYLVKFIDTSEALSIQVHPGDEYARINENSSGKTECWLITHAEVGSGIYLGLKEGVSKEDFEASLHAKKAMNELLNFYIVQPGDFYYVPPGTIHAIGAGITLAEVQQNSGITYRVWDWNRLDDKGQPRELHIKKSLDVINFDSVANRPEHFQMKRSLFQLHNNVQLFEHESFKLTLFNLVPNETIEIKLSETKRVPSLLNLTHSLKVNCQSVSPMSALVFVDESKLLIESSASASFLLIE
jgi:mannose-6-phosphate isomerase